MPFFVMCKQAFCFLPYKVMCACSVQRVYCVHCTPFDYYSTLEAQTHHRNMI